jgi:hypothetical protein
MGDQGVLGRTLSWSFFSVLLAPLPLVSLG